MQWYWWDGQICICISRSKDVSWLIYIFALPVVSKQLWETEVWAQALDVTWPRLRPEDTIGCEAFWTTQWVTVDTTPDITSASVLYADMTVTDSNYLIHSNWWYLWHNLNSIKILSLSIVLSMLQEQILKEKVYCISSERFKSHLQVYLQLPCVFILRKHAKKYLEKYIWYSGVRAGKMSLNSTQKFRFKLHFFCWDNLSVNYFRLFGDIFGMHSSNPKLFCMSSGVLWAGECVIWWNEALNLRSRRLLTRGKVRRDLMRIGPEWRQAAPCSGDSESSCRVRRTS